MARRFTMDHAKVDSACHPSVMLFMGNVPLYIVRYGQPSVGSSLGRTVSRRLHGRGRSNVHSLCICSTLLLTAGMGRIDCNAATAPRGF